MAKHKPTETQLMQLLKARQEFIALSKEHGYLNKFCEAHQYNYDSLKNLRSLKVRCPFTCDKILEINKQIIEHKKILSYEAYFKIAQMDILDFL